MALAACSGSGGNSGTSGNGAPAAKGGTITFAEKPGTKPNYIFPMLPSASASVYNSNFSGMMFRSLYYAPKGASPEYDYALSIGQAPKFSSDGKSVVVNMNKNYKWSNGEPVNARDVIFYINLLKAAVKEDPSNFSNYTPGLFPDFLTSYKATGDYQFTLTMNRTFNPTWFKYNALNLIIPFPMAWDKTSASGASGNADTTPAGAKQVYDFLAAQAKDTSTYNTNPLWKVVDGPWQLQNFSNSGKITMVPNPKYGGKYKPTVDQFVWLPFTSEAAEYNQLLAGKLTIGYVPSSDFPQIPRVKNQGYNITSIPDFGFYYIVPNFNNPTAGPIFHQLYFRQAFAHLINQQSIIKNVYDGYAQPAYGPVPVSPPNPYVTSFEKSDPYPYDINKTKSILQANGWKVTPGGVDTCIKPGTGQGQCGKGITQGQQLSFEYAYASDSDPLTKIVPALKSDASKAGIQLNLKGEDFNTLISNNSACKPTDKSCAWQIQEFGGITGIVYPTGEVLLKTGAGLNIGSWSDPKTDQLIDATIYSTDPNAMANYENYITKQQPTWWVPNEDQVYATTKKLADHNDAIKGLTQNSLLPEEMYFTK